MYGLIGHNHQAGALNGSFGAWRYRHYLSIQLFAPSGLITPLISSIVSAVEKFDADSPDCCCNWSPLRTPLAIRLMMIVSSGELPSGNWLWFDFFNCFGAIICRISLASVAG